MSRKKPFYNPALEDLDLPSALTNEDKVSAKGRWFTAEEVIAALKCCADATKNNCVGCPCKEKGFETGDACIPAMCEAALELINRHTYTPTNEPETLEDIQAREERIGL